MFNSKNSHPVLILGSIAIATIAVGCGKGSADIAITSPAVSFTGATALNSGLSSTFLSGGGFTSAAVSATDFSFCVKRVRLEGEDDEPVLSDDEDSNVAEDHGYIQFTPGLITVSDNAAVNWGTVSLPVDFKLKRIKIKVQKSPANCSGANYSVKFNGVESTEDIEFRWRFEPALDLDGATSALDLSLSGVVSALRNAGTIDATHIKQAIEGVEGSGEKH